MKKLLLLLLCVPLIFSCGENEKDDTINKLENRIKELEDNEEVQDKEKVEIEKFGEIVIKLDNETLKWQQWAKNIKCCTPNEFYLINTSFNKKIQFTLQVEWHNHYHTKIRTSSNCYQCKYTKKERKNILQGQDTTIQTIENELNIKTLDLIVLNPGQRKKLYYYHDDGGDHEGPDCWCDTNLRIYNRVKKYSVVGEHIIEE